MRILLVDAGASVSIKDVFVGVNEAFETLGHEVFVYSLEHRLELAHRWVRRLWVMKGKNPDRKPTWDDTIYRGSIEALEMALRFDVDWVIAVSARFFHPDAVYMMRKAGIKVAVLFTESPYEDDKQATMASLCSAVWTNERISVPFLQMVCGNVFYSPHAYRPSVHGSEGWFWDDETPSHDVVFVGTDFWERIELLEQIDWTGIDLGLYGAWKLLPPKHKLRKHLVINGFVENDSTAQLYRQSKIGLNLHRRSTTYKKKAPTITLAESLNPRAFELAACGVFQISDRREEGVEIFGSSVPTFQTAQELEELIRTYLGDQQRRRSLAAAAVQRVAPYTFESKVAQMIQDLESLPNGN